VDWGSVAGLLLALGGVALGLQLEGGHLGSILQPTAFVIVVAGTLGAVLLQSNLKLFVRGVKMLVWVFRPPADDSEALIVSLGNWSIVARREGLLSLEPFMNDALDPFVKSGLRLLIDGTTPDKLRAILEVEIGTYELHQKQAVKIWDAAGGYAPTLGILGAVLGLIHVMENLSDPSQLGSGIAVAFVATIYGIGLANLVFLPIGNKLKAVINRKINRMDMLQDSFCGIAGGDNPRIIQERARAYFP
jgi:chemotaxis protein MotA